MHLDPPSLRKFVKVLRRRFFALSHFSSRPTQVCKVGKHGRVPTSKEMAEANEKKGCIWEVERDRQAVRRDAEQPVSHYMFILRQAESHSTDNKW